MSDDDQTRLIALTARIVSDKAASGSVAGDALPELIRTVYAALKDLGSDPAPADDATRTAPEPAVPVRRSVFPDHIICLEDGRRLTSLKRHVKAHHGMTLDEYRTKWGLPRDYPTVAPNYAAQRSQLARNVGLGRRPAAPSAQPSEAPVTKEAPVVKEDVVADVGV